MSNLRVAALALMFPSANDHGLGVCLEDGTGLEGLFFHLLGPAPLAIRTNHTLVAGLIGGVHSRDRFARRRRLLSARNAAFTRENHLLVETASDECQGSTPTPLQTRRSRPPRIQTTRPRNI